MMGAGEAAGGAPAGGSLVALGPCAAGGLPRDWRGEQTARSGAALAVLSRA